MATAAAATHIVLRAAAQCGLADDSVKPPIREVSFHLLIFSLYFLETYANHPPIGMCGAIFHVCCMYMQTLTKMQQIFKHESSFGMVPWCCTCPADVPAISLTWPAKEDVAAAIVVERPG